MSVFALMVSQASGKPPPFLVLVFFGLLVGLMLELDAQREEGSQRG